MAIERGFKGPEGKIGQTVAIIEASSSTPVALTAHESETEAPVIVDIISTVNCFIRITPSTGTPVAGVSNGYFVVANAVYRIPVTTGALFSAISAVGAGGGNVYIHPVS